MGVQWTERERARQHRWRVVVWGWEIHRTPAGTEYRGCADQGELFTWTDIGESGRTGDHRRPPMPRLQPDRRQPLDRPHGRRGHLGLPMRHEWAITVESGSGRWRGDSPSAGHRVPELGRCRHDPCLAAPGVG
jgi:hypothetical protein